VVKDPLDKEVLVRFGQRVREEREKRGLSQEKLADLADLHRTYISLVERAEKNITLWNAARLARVLGVEITDLLRKSEY
jgi:transcriptional regulator with XRE-family HTH domain